MYESKKMRNLIESAKDIMEISGASENKVKDIDKNKTLWNAGGQYFVISSEPNRTTTVMLSDKDGKIQSSTALWTDNGHQKHDRVADFVSQNLRSLMILHRGNK
jgi:hypothetical protein